MNNTNEKNSVFKNIKNIVTTIVTLLLILVAIVIVLQRFTSITLFGFRMYIVATGSMTPVYNVGDVILSKEVDENSLEVGDDIVYQGEKGNVRDKIITHRIIKIEEENGELVFQTKGLNNTLEDPKISSEQIYGKVITKLRVLTFICSLAENKYTIYFCLVVPITLFVFFEIIHVKRRKDS